MTTKLKIYEVAFEGLHERMLIAVLLQHEADVMTLARQKADETCAHRRVDPGPITKVTFIGEAYLDPRAEG